MTEAGEQGPDIVAAGWPWSFNMDSVASGRSREVIRRWWRAGTAVLLLLTGVAAARWPGWSWQRVLDLAELGRVWWPLAVAGVLVVVLAPLRPLRRPVEGRVREPRWLWLLSDRGIGAATLAVATLGIAVMVVLLAVAAGATGNERPKLQVEAIKYGLGATAAAGAAAALLLALRRQRLADEAHALALKAQEHVERDAAERHVTDLYTKAAEQLGHAEAAVRLAGLYALERVGQNNPDQRQTIVDVLCAYLRMPYRPPPGDPERHGPVIRMASDDAGPSGPEADEPLVDGVPARDPRQERQVRLTAQRILTRHLTLPDGVDAEHVALPPAADQPFWPDINLDLTGATLIDWHLTGGHVDTASFDQATFRGYARFDQTRFTGDAWFTGATFTGDVWFTEATFSSDAHFLEARFRGHTGFDRVRFRAGAGFGAVTFHAGAAFNGATFHGSAIFMAATFRNDAGFDGATFHGGAVLTRATFHDDARFDGATFHGGAAFDMATFHGSARFAQATFHNHAAFSRATLHGDLWLNHARAAASQNRDRAWPPGWTALPSEDPEWLQIVAEAAEAMAAEEAPQHDADPP